MVFYEATALGVVKALAEAVKFCWYNFVYDLMNKQSRLVPIHIAHVVEDDG